MPERQTVLPAMETVSQVCSRPRTNCSTCTGAAGVGSRPSEGKASTSFIQRHLNIGYNKAAKLIEQMEKEGIVGPANHAGKREILVPTEEDKM